MFYHQKLGTKFALLSIFSYIAGILQVLKMLQKNFKKIRNGCAYLLQFLRVLASADEQNQCLKQKKAIIAIQLDKNYNDCKCSCMTCITSAKRQLFYITSGNRILYIISSRTLNQIRSRKKIPRTTALLSANRHTF